MKFVKAFLRALDYGIKISFMFRLLCPIIIFMVVFSDNIDRSGLFQGALAPRTAVELMLDGSDVTNFEQMDERTIVRLYSQLVPKEQAPAVSSIGSSRASRPNSQQAHRPM